MPERATTSFSVECNGSPGPLVNARTHREPCVAHYCRDNRGNVAVPLGVPGPSPGESLSRSELRRPFFSRSSSISFFFHRYGDSTSRNLAGATHFSRGFLSSVPVFRRRRGPVSACTPSRRYVGSRGSRKIAPDSRPHVSRVNMYRLTIATISSSSRRFAPIICLYRPNDMGRLFLRTDDIPVPVANRLDFYASERTLAVPHVRLPRQSRQLYRATSRRYQININSAGIGAPSRTRR